MKKIEFTNEQISNIIEMYKSYVTVADITKKYNVNKKVIYNLLKENGIELHGEKRTLNPIQVTDVINMYINGHTLQDIANKYGVNRWTIKHCLQENEINLRSRSESIRKYNIDENFFDEINTPEKAYVLGLLWSDGCNKTDRGTVTLKLQEEDRHILEDIKKLMHIDKPLYFYQKTNDNHHNMYSLEITNKHISDMLDVLGMKSAKSLILKFPEWLDKTLYNSFLRGIVDGDGCIFKASGQYCVSIVGTKSLCEYIQIFLKSIDINSKIYSYNDNGITVSLYISGKNNSSKFLDYIYKDATIYLNRKHDIYVSKFCNNINNSLLE